MPRIQSKLAIASALTIIVLITIQPLMVTSQTVETLDPRFGGTIEALHRAESAGATPSEIRELVVLLNKALGLDGEALKLNSTEQSQRRSELFTQVEQTLATVENRTAELTAVASQRTYASKVFTYVAGAMAAILGTIAYAFVISFYQKYRVKRTFQMRVIRK